MGRASPPVVFMQFVHQPLTWGFFLVLLPLLIHLINMMRHRRVSWAAMDFLLQAYRKHRKWIWLKQLLLLLMRMAVVAVVVAMLAQWVTRGQWFQLFGGTPTHHYVLLDDSVSMSDRWGGTSAFDLALSAVQRIGAQASSEDTPQRFTLIRYSRAARWGSQSEGEEAASVADFLSHVVDADFDVTLEEARHGFEVTELAVGPTPALSVLAEMIRESREEHRMVYLVSDFRSAEWSRPREARDSLREIEDSVASIQLVDCVQEMRQNLAVVDIRPVGDTQAAGVPLFVSIAVRNFGPQTARNVPLNVRTVYYPPESSAVDRPESAAGRVDDLPTVLIEEIEPGQTVERRVQVFFPQPGRHVVKALLPDDPVAADNRRWCVLEFPEHEPVLIVDGSPDQRHAYFLESVFRPGGRVTTGIAPEVHPPVFLRDVAPQRLEDYRAIFLLDVSRLDERAVETLETYVSGGGGLAFFAGPQVDPSYYTQRFYRGGTGLFPLPLEREDFLPREDMGRAPDIEVAEHPVFEVFLDERNPFIRLITVETYVRPSLDWRPDPESGVTVAASLRNGMPLVVERRFGEGRVVAFLTALAPGWNNWGNDPSFVVVALRLQAHLAAGRRDFDARSLGSPLSVVLPAEGYREDFQFVVPGELPDTRQVIDVSASRREGDANEMQVRIGGRLLDDATDRSGIYEAWTVRSTGQADVRRFALNVDPDGGDLRLVDPAELLAALEPVRAEYQVAQQYTYEQAGWGQGQRNLLLLILLVGLLLGEQAVAYSASYHPPR